MKRLSAAVVACIGLVLLVAAMRPADAQDTDTERINALESRVAALETIVASGSGAESAATYEISGVVKVLYDVDEGYFPDECSGTKTLNDFRAWADVIVRDEAGAIVGKGQLFPGVLALPGTPTPTPDADGTYTSCYFTFSIDGIPARAFYTITYGESELGGTIFSFDDLERMDWSIEEAIEGGLFFTGKAR